MKPRKLEKSTDYRPALLWLMGELERARTADAVAEFGQRLGDLIPARHRDLNKSGSVKWENYVRWARQALVSAGLMGSGGHGIWTITDAGRKWLRDHPDGAKHKLTELVQGNKTAPGEPSRSDGLSRDAFYQAILERLRGKLPGGVDNRSYNPEVNYLRLTHPAPRAQYEITLHKSVTYVGLVFYGSGDENRARLAPFQEAVPQLEAKLERSVETHVGGKSYSTVRLRLPPARLDPATARQLADTWLDFIEDTLPILERVVPAQESGSGGLSRGAFYRTILERLKGELPGGIHNRSYNPEVNYLLLNHPARATYYEIVLNKSSTYLGLVFRGPGDENRARLAPFQEALPQLEAELERSVETHVGGKSYSTVRLRLPPAQLDVSTARQLADTLLSFIEITLPVLEQVVPREESGSGGLSREAFYRSVLERLKGKLPGGIHNRSYNPEVNYLRLNHPAPRTYYEIALHKSVTYVGLVFYGPGDENRARLAPFQEGLPQLEAELDQPLETHVGGESYSTVRLRLPPARLDAATARQLADTWLSFIEVTLPVLERVVAELGLLVRTSKPSDKDLERPKAILAREVRNIRAYLNGDRNLSPSDQMLCNWIQFCYTFELFSEGVALFKLVRGNAVDPWLYERTQKLARACELRADR